MRNLLVISILCLLFVSNASAQNIRYRSADTLTVYDLIYAQSLVNTNKNVLNDLNKKITRYQDKLNAADIEINKYNDNIEKYKVIYAKLLKYYYFFVLQQKNTASFLLSSNSVSNYFSRFNFLSLLLKYIKNINVYIQTNVELLNNSKTIYNNYSSSLDIFMKEYQNTQIENNNLVKNILYASEQLQQNNQELRILLDKEHNYYQNFIKNEILDEPKNENKVVNTSNFKPIYPIDNPVVISSFGEHKHPSLKNVTVINDGIDLYSEFDTVVCAVFAGTVVKIVEVPNYGKSLLVRHIDNYFSVYSNLNTVLVEEGQKVKKSDEIATLNKKVSKYSFPCLNLQIWNGANKLNPRDFIVN